MVKATEPEIASTKPRGGVVDGQGAAYYFLLMNAQDALYQEYVRKLHAVAVAGGEHSYIDPRTGYMVMTELHHQARGHCCQSGCRHCPYGFEG